MSPSSSSSSDCLLVNCGGFEGSFSKSRYARGVKSRCVQFRGEWMTPLQFEEMSGLGASHNWKRSLRYKGKPLAYWINKGIIKNSHAGSTSPPLHKGKNQGSSGPPSPATNLIMPQHTNLLKLKDPSDDSDSGISVTSSSFTKALKVDVSSSPPVTVAPSSSSAASGSPKTPLLPADEVASTASSCSTITATTSSAAEDAGVDSNLPDYTTLVQEALYSLRDASSSSLTSASSPLPPPPSKGCSQLNILLYVLHRYSPKEDIRIVNAKVRSALRFLSRMDLIQRTGPDGVEEPESDLEEEVERGKEVQEADDANSGKTLSSSAPTEPMPAKKTKTPAAAEKKGDFTQKKKGKNILEAQKKPKGRPPSSSSSAKPKIRPKPKKLSPPLAALCATKKANRQDVLKALWAYIKKKKLQHPKDPTIILCDEKLKAVMKKKQIQATEMLRLISEHMFTIEAKKKKKKKD